MDGSTELVPPQVMCNDGREPFRGPARRGVYRGDIVGTHLVRSDYLRIRLRAKTRREDACRYVGTLYLVINQLAPPRT